MKRFFRFLISKVFIYNILGAFVFAIIALFAVMTFIRVFTKHGEAITVPNLIGLQVYEVDEICEKYGLNYVISDSVYHDYFDKGAIVEQFPKPEHKVKEGRKIYLITNCFNEEMVEMPQFIGYSIRQVQSVAETYGLQIGKLSYVPDIAVNVIIRQYYKGDDIAAGTRVPKGASIDLLVGLGISDRKTMVPNLYGLNLREASDRLLEDYLNVGAVRYDNTVKTRTDSAIAKVYKQSPVRSTINLVNLGYNIDIWLTKDETLIVIPEEEDDEVLTIE